MSPRTTEFGFLSHLPREVRDLIWESTMPSHDHETNLDILRTCHQTYDEVAPLVYQNEVLRLKISPAYQYQSWLSIVTRRGAQLHLRDLSDARSRGFSSLPYQKLKGIRIEIDAPDKNYPGQVICLWKKVVALVNLLSPIDSLPDIEIHLISADASNWDGRCEWSTGGIAQQTIPDSLDYPWYDEYTEDFEAVLLPFCRLRNCRSASVQVETPIHDVGYLLENVGCLMSRKEPFGTFIATEDFWSDDNTQERLDTIFLQFDFALDTLPDSTADMLRLERFSSWFEDGLQSEPRYLKELWDVQQRPNQSSEVYMFYGLDWRCFLMLAYNPLSAAMQEMRFQKHWWVTRDGPNAFPLRNQWDSLFWRDYYKMSMKCDDDRFLEEEDGTYESRWDRQEWHRYYPRGIPSFQSEGTTGRSVEMSDDTLEMARDMVKKAFASFRSSSEHDLRDGSGPRAPDDSCK